MVLARLYRPSHQYRLWDLEYQAHPMALVLRGLPVGLADLECPMDPMVQFHPGLLCRLSVLVIQSHPMDPTLRDLPYRLWDPVLRPDLWGLVVLGDLSYR